MRFLVIGAGSIGQRHCRNLVTLGHEVLAWDIDPARLALAACPGVKQVASLEEGLEGGPSGALICSPPAFHLKLAEQAVAAGVDVFIEKPISHNSEGVEIFLHCARRRERLVMVGYNLRFLPSLRRVKALLDEKRIGRVLSVHAEFGAYLPEWRPGRDYRENYAVRAALGGGILLDAIHEFDYLGWFFGRVTEVSCIADHVSDLAGDTEDLAEATLRFESGVLAHVHLDYVQRTYRRRLHLIGDGGSIFWNYPDHSVTIQCAEAEAVQEEVGSEGVDANRMYLDEIADFVRRVQQHKAPLVDGWEALRSLRIVEAAKESASQRRVVPL